MIRNNVEGAKKVTLAPQAPNELKVYLQDLVTVAEAAMHWCESVEESLLKRVCERFGDTAAATSVASPPSSSFPTPQESPLPTAPPQHAVVPADESLSQLSFDEVRARAEELALAVLQVGLSESDFSRIEAEKKSLIATLLKRRERFFASADSEGAKTCDNFVRFLEDNVVAIKSIAETLQQLEGQLYSLVDARGALRNGDRDAATELRKRCVSFRKVLRAIKERWLKGPLSGAVQAELDRLTDIQENASNLQLDLETHFAGLLDNDFDSVVQQQRHNRALRAAEEDHQRAEQMFEL